MNKNNAIILGVAAMLALAASLPLEWMTIDHSWLQAGSGSHDESQTIPSWVFPNGSPIVKVTGISTNFTFLARLPIWLAVVTGLAGVLLALLNSLRVISISKVVPLLPLTWSAIYVLDLLVMAIGDSHTAIGVGMFTALTGLILGHIHALTYRISPEQGAAR